MAVNLRLRRRSSAVCVFEASDFRERVESRLDPRGDGVGGGKEMLDAVGTLLKRSERFLEI